MKRVTVTLQSSIESTLNETSTENYACNTTTHATKSQYEIRYNTYAIWHKMTHDIMTQYEKSHKVIKYKSSGNNCVFNTDDHCAAVTTLMTGLSDIKEMSQKCQWHQVKLQLA